MIRYVVKVYNDGTKEWYLNSKLHNEDGPAIEWSNGNKWWYLNDKLHREDGPAIECADGTKEWYLNGKKLTESEWQKRLSRESCDGKVVEIDGVQYQLKELR